ncbi:ABC transporter permease [Arthrobacter cavernae]|uniref:ABC transporter permease n=1 Tax=Arthrobacter cavernae TaxID=2817681 RepID=A0A939HF65_9MICC|nr:ABC transporter permease [Arthrobacter cavernae]MBO1269792.1 ABC transporter permease [Arthrobacter cavernae]
MSDLADSVPTLAGVGLLMALTVAVLLAFRAPRGFAPTLAILRGAVQLAAISFILGGVITSPAWVAVALLVMFAVAVVSATRRLGWSWPHLTVVGGSMALGITVTLLIIFGTGAIGLTPRYALAIGGIVIGNAMTVAVLAGQRFAESVHGRWEEVEGWLALGASPRQATLDLARRSVYAALIPATDQTKTTGLVTLPGAFVGAIFGGISPLEAGRFQIVVLAAIMAAGSITAVMVIAQLAPVRVRPALPR